MFKRVKKWFANNFGTEPDVKAATKEICDITEIYLGKRIEEENKKKRKKKDIWDKTNKWHT